MKPLARAVLSAPHCYVVLLDRGDARILDLYMGELSEREKLQDEASRRARSDGYAGYEAGHIDRHNDNEAMRHYKRVADRMLELQTQSGMDAVVFVCRAEVWSEMEPHLHPYVRQRLIGHIDKEPAGSIGKNIREPVIALLEEQRAGEEQARIREVIGEAQRNGRGSLGLRHVVASLERGEVQSLLMGEGFSAAAVECTHCGHMDTRMVAQCAACAKPTKELGDIADALVGHALRRGVEIIYVNDDQEFRQAGNIGALLRFRADQNTSEKLAS